MKDLQGKAIFITGAASGIGLALYGLLTRAISDGDMQGHIIISLINHNGSKRNHGNYY